jgi:hypothetical protein
MRTRKYHQNHLFVSFFLKPRVLYLQKEKKKEAMSKTSRGEGKSIQLYSCRSFCGLDGVECKRSEDSSR